MKLKEALKDELTEEELSLLKTSFDQVGSIAIIEIPPELESKEGLIGERIIEINKPITTVLKKTGFHEGEFRTQKLEVIAGEATKEAEYKESGCRFKLDVEQVYFSPRLSTERLRVADQVQQGEEVLVMFSGCAPYVCVIAKNTDAAKVVGVEKNPIGHEYAEINVALNKLKNAEVYCGDVRDVVPDLGKFDRIIMPLPKNADTFLDVAIPALKSGGVIHMYDFVFEKDYPDESLQKVREGCKEMGVACEILDTVIAGQIGIRNYRVCVDFRVEK